MPVALDRLRNAFVGSDLLDNVEFFCEGQRDGLDILQEIRVCIDVATYGRTPCEVPFVHHTCDTAEIWFLGNSSEVMKAGNLIVFLMIFIVYFITT